MFPAASERHPERHENQANVESETLPVDVDAIVFELVTARNVAWSVDLGDAGESWAYAVALDVAGDGFHLHVPAVGRRFDFTGPKRSGADEAHVAPQDVPELWQLVHRSSAQHAAYSRDARVVFGRLYGADSCFGVRNHRSELERAENASPFADAFLPVEDRPAVQLDRRRDQPPEGRRGDEPSRRKRDVERPLGPRHRSDLKGAGGPFIDQPHRPRRRDRVAVHAETSSSSS